MGFRRIAATVMLFWPLHAGICRSAEPLPTPIAAAVQAPCQVAAPGAEYAGPPPSHEGRGIRVGSCGTVSCHGGPKSGNTDVQAFAFTIWRTDDPHSRAYEVLHEPRSVRMAGLLGIGAPHRARECLACHSMQPVSEAALPKDVLAGGVGCASCHGDATHWEMIHHLPEWKHVSKEQRESIGYRDLSGIQERVRNCIPCHVGDAFQEVNHDLIAAGHPRLSFEFAAYQRLWPRHWSPAGKVESTVDFNARSWAAGQAETLAAVADLLHVRAERAEADATAGRGRRWPEFAEFDCYACHQALGPTSYAGATPEEFRPPIPGRPSWQPWYVSAGRLVASAASEPREADGQRVDAMAADVIDIRRVFEPDWHRADAEQLRRVMLEAKGLALSARAYAHELAARERIVLDVSHRSLADAVTADPTEWRFWDSAVQTYLAMEAGVRDRSSKPGLRRTIHGHPRAPGLRTALDDLRESLRFPHGVDSPRGFDPSRFQQDRAAVPLPLGSIP